MMTIDDEHIAEDLNARPPVGQASLVARTSKICDNNHGGVCLPKKMTLALIAYNKIGA